MSKEIINKVILILLDIISRSIMGIFLLVVLLSALTTAALRYYLPQVDDYRESILAQLNANNRGIIVSAEKIQSDWRPFRPGLDFHAVSIQHKDWDKGLHVKELGLELDVVNTVLTRSLRFSEIELIDLELLLAQNNKGKWTLAGLSSDEDSPLDIEQLVDQIWSVGRVQLSNINIRLQPYQKERVKLPSLHVSMYSNGSGKQITANLSEKSMQLSRLLIETDGFPLDDSFSANAYWQLIDYPLSDVWALLQQPDRQLKSAALSGEFWLSWSENGTNLRGHLTLDDLLLALKKEGLLAKEKTLQLDQATLTFLLQREGEDIKSWIPYIELRHQQQHLRVENISVQQSKKLQLQVGHLNLKPINDFIQQLPLPKKLSAAMNDLSPSGHLKNVHVDLFKEDDGAWDFNVTGQLDDVAVGAFKGAPALKHVNGVIKASKAFGEIQLQTDEFEMAFPALYDNEMVFNKASAQIAWQMDKTDILVQGTHLALEGDYGKARGEFHLQLPKDKKLGDVARLALDVGLVNSDAKYRDRFIPKNLPPKLLTWLRENIHSGDVKKAGFIYHGPISKSKVKSTELADKKAVQLWLEVDDGRISYLPDWADVRALSGHVYLDNKNVAAQIDSAMLDNIKVDGAQVSIESVGDKQQLTINGKAKATAASAMMFLQQPALQEKTDFLQDWKITGGNVLAKVSLSAVIQDMQSTLKLNVNTQLYQANVQLDAYGLQFNKVSGPLLFDLQKGLSSKGLKAQFWGETLDAKINVEDVAGDKSTHIYFSSIVAAKDIARWSGQPAFTLLSGQSLFNGDIYFGDTGAGLQLESDLKGIDIDLPKPFYKTSDELRDFSLQLPFSGENKELRAKIGPSVDVRFQMGEEGFTGGKINLGLKKSSYQKGKIIIGGQLAYADAEQWLKTYQQYNDNASSFDASSSVFYQDEKEGENAWAIEVEKLHIRQLHAYGQGLTNIKFDLFDTQSYWQMAVVHPQVTGRLRIFREDIPMKLTLQHVDLDFIRTQKVDEAKADDASALVDVSLGDFPEMDVDIESVWWQGEDYGEWQFNMRSSPNSISLENLRASIKKLQLSATDSEAATLRWSLGGNAKTEFNGRFSGENLADVLAAWGYSQEIISESAEFDVQVSWLGGPDDYSVDKMMGNTTLKLRKGSFADVSSSQSGALKVVGFMNISMLLRRLQLDFSDLSSKGLAYDRVDGQVFFDKGVFTLKDELRVVAPSSSIKLKGWADINTDAVDMDMGVSLPIASNIPWVIALAAGLPAAAGVYIVSKLLKKQVGTLFSAIYKVSGDLNDPAVEFVRLFDTGLPTSSTAPASKSVDDKPVEPAL